MRILLLLMAPFALLPACVAAQVFTPKLVNVGPVFIDFGTVNVGTTVAVPVSIRNLTAGTLTLAGGGVSGGVGFSSALGGNTCGGSLAAGLTCTISYRFRPVNSDGSLREDSTAISFSNGTRSQTVPIAFAGRGSGSLIHVAPLNIDYGDVLLGDSASVKVFLTNIGTDNVSFFGGCFNTNNGFSCSNGCTPPLVPGASCFQQYTFQPSQVGEVQNTAGLSAVIPSPQFGEVYAINVRGRGISAPPLVAFSPITFDFGNALIGTESRVEVKYKNLGGSPIQYAGGAINAPFESFPAVGPGCQSGGTADAGATCTFSFFFRPLTVGPVTETTSLTFSRQGASQIVNISVSGTGMGQFGRVWPRIMNFGQVRLGTTISAPVTITNTTRLPLVSFIGGGVAPPFSSSNNCPSSLPVGQSCQYTFTFTANAASFGPRMAETSLSFTNADNVQPAYSVTLLAEGFDRLFGHSFE